MAKTESGAQMMRRGSGSGRALAQMMQSRIPNMAIVYVEGESDINFYKWLVNRDKVTLSPMQGKEAAVEAILYDNKTCKKGRLAIVDSDFDNILNIDPDKNIIRTDTHDIETLMLREGIFRTSEERYANTRKMDSFGLSFDNVYLSIMDIGCTMGKIRLISHEQCLNLNFKEVERKLEIDNLIYIQEGKVNFNVRQYIWECQNASFNCPKKFSEIYSIFLNDNRTFDPWQICRGHDLSLLISILYSKNMIGKRNVYKEEIENVVSIGYIYSNKFKTSRMYNDIKEWQKENTGWVILSDGLV